MFEIFKFVSDKNNPYNHIKAIKVDKIFSTDKDMIKFIGHDMYRFCIVQLYDFDVFSHPYKKYIHFDNNIVGNNIVGNNIEGVYEYKKKKLVKIQDPEKENILYEQMVKSILKEIDDFIQNKKYKSYTIEKNTLHLIIRRVYKECAEDTSVNIDYLMDIQYVEERKLGEFSHCHIVYMRGGCDLFLLIFTNKTEPIERLNDLDNQRYIMMGIAPIKI